MQPAWMESIGTNTGKIRFIPWADDPYWYKMIKKDAALQRSKTILFREYPVLHVL